MNLRSTLLVRSRNKQVAATFVASFAALSMLLAPHCHAAADKSKTSGKPASAKEDANKYRLPEQVKPIDYDLRFQPDLNKFTFNGSEGVRIQLAHPTSEIVMNSVGLKISEASLSPVKSVTDGNTDKGGEQNALPLQVKLEPETEKVHFISRSSLKPGEYVLNCKFAGALTNELRGFYRAGYEDDNHKKHWLAVTQLEPADARRMFPAFDEPAYKAVFNIQVTIDKSLVAISNAPILKETDGPDNKKTVVFDHSPKMSSYLLALCVGDFKCTGETKSGDIPIRVWTVAGKEHLGNYALSEAGKILDYESNYFGLPYLGKKLDLIALPEFSAGAMENVGAITFSDTLLLMDDKTGASAQKQDISGTMAHEMAHQWFGDLVTMRWWDDLWLNEAFASWMTTKVLDGIHPEWRSLVESVETRNWAMHMDAMKSTRAIHAHVSNPAQAVEMFDGITYTKGEAVLRMLETYVGKDKYQEGIKKYLQAHAFANATASDFWSAIGHEATGVPVPQLMKSFVFQPGYPQVNVSPSADSKTLSFTQYRQFKLGQDKNDPTLWLVPLVARGLGSKADDSAGHLGFLLKDRTQNVDVNANGSPFFINDGGTGYYRTCYEKKQLQEIQNKFADLSTDDKLVLIGDCDSLVLPGDVAVENFLDFTDKLKSEKDPLILSNLVHLIDGVDPFIEEKERTRLQHFTQVTLAPLKQGLDGWNQKESDSEHTKQLRGYVLSDLGTFGHDEKTIGEARELFAKYKADNKSFNPDLVSTVLDVVTYNGSAKEYDEMLSMYKKAKTPADAERALFQLGEFRQPELAKRTFDFCMSKDLKQQHGIRLICELVSNRYIRATSWTLIKQHWDEMQHKFAPEMFANIAGIPAAFDAAQSETELKAWFATHPVPFGKSQVARSLESMHTKVLYRQKYGERIRKWVRNAAERN